MYKIIEALQKFFRPLTKYGTLILIIAIFIAVSCVGFQIFYTDFEDY